MSETSVLPPPPSAPIEPGVATAAPPAATAHPRKASRQRRERKRRRRRVALAGTGPWMLLGAFAFIAMESVLLAVTLQGRWFILLAPGAVCGLRAWDQWRRLQNQAVEKLRR